MRTAIISLFIIGMVLSGLTPLCAQVAESTCLSDHRIDPERKGSLWVEIDNLSFFKDDEYTGLYLKGYTLPGLWLDAKAVYYPLGNMKLEAGIHALRFWGADRYPNMAYQDIATWKGNQYHHGLHLLPWFRAEVTLSDVFTIVMGDLYGAANHRLVEPLYNPELNMIADPEMGLQFLLDTRRLDLDVWINWESFIFREDTHQEAFTLGLSGRLKWNDPASSVHLYSPIQLLGQHRGGEIDTLTAHSVQTLINGAAGLGTIWRMNASFLKQVGIEVDVAGYYQQSGSLWPFDRGIGFYTKAYADVKALCLKAGYWKCHRFISLFGNPFFGAVSTVEKGMTFDDPSQLFWGVEYGRSLGKGFSLGVDLDVYHHLPVSMYRGEVYAGRTPLRTSFSAGVYLRVNPSFLIKRF